MNEAPNPPIFPSDLPPAEVAPAFSRFRQSAADGLFELSRTFPKLLALPSTPRAWTGFRILLGALGAALVVLPLSLWNAWAFAPVGLVLFLLAVLLPPIRQDRGAAKAIQQLGAYMVLDGGRLSCGNLSPGADQPCAINFYLTKTRVWALDGQLRPVAVIPTDEINSVTAVRTQGDWLLRLTWQSGSAEFTFAGLFAERRARLAEQGLLCLVKSVETSPAKAKAASA